jgi:predicted transcriptional regulator
MEERRRPGHTREKGARRHLELAERRGHSITHDEKQGEGHEEKVVFMKQPDAGAAKRKWGWGLIILGFITILEARFFPALPVIGPSALWLGGALIIFGLILAHRGPRMKETNEALLIAMKYDNHLTVPRLALEMDISLEKAEKILQNLVRNGVAEIDLDTDDESGVITYKIKGI